MSEKQIEKIMRKMVLTDEDIEILAEHERQKFRRAE